MTQLVRLIAYVEGQTEEAFCKEVLYEHLLLQHRIELIPVLCHGWQGGHCRNYDTIWPDLVRLLKGELGSCWVTTMLDLYGLPANFPRPSPPLPSAPRDRARLIEQSFFKDIEGRVGNDRARRFLPNLLIHEFEALLFSDTAQMQEVLYEVDLKARLDAIVAECGGPEGINEGPETAPAKRIKALYPRYNKPNDGVMIAGLIGLPAIRAKCPHFHDWVRCLEAISPPQPAWRRSAAGA